MRIYIKPLDTLFLRDGRSFNKGEDNYGATVFPPSPFTVYGMLRFAIINYKAGGYRDFLYEADDKMRKEVGTPHSIGSFNIKGPFLMLDGETYYAMPRDLINHKEDKPGRFKPLAYKSESEIPFFSDMPLGCNWDNDTGKVNDASSYYISAADMERYLNGYKSDYFIGTPLSSFIEYEPKVGIQIDNATGAAQSEYFYRADMLRLKLKAGFAVDAYGSELLPKHGVMRMGGEGKMVSYETVAEDEIRYTAFESIAKSKKFKIYLATPAVFKNGWLPDFIDKTNYRGYIGDIEVKLDSACVGKASRIGGWDIQAGKPKPMVKVVPPGSVYYFSITNSSSSLSEDDVRALAEKIHYMPINSDYDGTLPKQGFNIAMLGCI